MNIIDIEYVITVANTHSFTKAANQLFVSQSAISQSVNRVEKELNLKLFIRDTKNVYPTPACSEFMETGNKIIDNFNQLKEEMKKYSSDNRDHLRIGTVSFFNKILSFHTDIIGSPELAGIKFEIFEDSATVVENMTFDGNLDFCFTRKPLLQQGLEFEPLFREELLIIVPKCNPICQSIPGCKNEIPVVELKYFKNCPFVMITNPRVIPICTNLCREAEFSPNIVYRTGTWEHVYSSVEKLNAVGFLSSLHVRQNNEDSDIQYFRIKSKYNTLEHVVAYASKNNLSDYGRKYIDLIKKHIDTTISLPTIN